MVKGLIGGSERQGFITSVVHYFLLLCIFVDQNKLQTISLEKC